MELAINSTSRSLEVDTSLSRKPLLDHACFTLKFQTTRAVTANLTALGMFRTHLPGSVVNSTDLLG